MLSDAATSPAVAGDGRGGDLWARLRLVLDPKFAGDTIELTGLGVANMVSTCSVDQCFRPAAAQRLCIIHRTRWKRRGCPPHEEFLADPGPLPAPQRVRLAGLSDGVRLEVAVAVQQIIAGRTDRKLHPEILSALLGRLRDHRVTSVLQPLPAALAAQLDRGRRDVRFALSSVIEALNGFADPRVGDPEAEFERDVWRLRVMGVADCRRSTVRFDGIPQLWLRQHAKRFLRWRISTGLSYSQLNRDSLALQRLADAFTAQAGISGTPDQFDRGTIESYLVLLVQRNLGPATRGYDICSVAAFLQAIRQHGWTPAPAPTAGIYPGDHPRRPTSAPRSLPEFVMAQLEDPANLGKLTQPHRLILQVLIGTGLRVADAIRLPLDCLVRDAQQAPYLRYFNHKMDRDAFVPIDEQIAKAVEHQQHHTLSSWPNARLLTPSDTDGKRPRSTTGVWAVITGWQQTCGLRDELGRPFAFTAHQLRHTYGTRLINADVPQEVVRRLLDHESAEMTARYARLKDDTVRRHWERARKVNIDGETIVLDANSPLSDAAWMKENLGRATMTLPNGYCGLPLQQSCPHANACLTCPVFITTPDFLAEHLAQLRTTREFIATAEANGQSRMAEMNQRVATNLENIIDALQTPDLATDPATDGDPAGAGRTDQESLEAAGDAS